ncbi:MAG: hypothetical protein H6830_06520 [Planctomycetes bacterium]|nr:hypothetical protein [Planctomycetota bacterium]MCB9910959.1 hypothetical protein [Planctomycetota bacterium]MCB9911574.1 hypothetical protein [Planctomycetota bacterium]HRV81225.1 hypothetical protein [Planctomycetota bacterium]
MYRIVVAAACLLSCLLSLSACFSGRSAQAQPYYESAGVRLFKISDNRTAKDGSYVFGAMNVEGSPKSKGTTRFALSMDYGRDANANGMLESEEILDTDRIQDGTAPFTYRIEELTLRPGKGQAIQRLRIEFDGQEPFRYERRELSAKP